MLEISVSEFRANLDDFVNKAVEEHQAIRIRCRSGKDFIVVCAEDWDREQETLYVLRNKSLMSQIAESVISYERSTGKSLSDGKIK